MRLARVQGIRDGSTMCFNSSEEDGVFTLVPVDIDILHPATGELAESKEDSFDLYYRGGLVAFRRDEATPATRLLIRAVPTAINGSKARIQVMNGGPASGTIRVWKDEGLSQNVDSFTEFDAAVDTILFLEGVDVTMQSDISIKQEVKLPGLNSWFEGDKVSIKVVQAEIPFILRAYIPHIWTAGEAPVPMEATIITQAPFVVPTAFSNTVGGDRVHTGYSADPEDPTFRLRQRVWLCPFRDLHSDAEPADGRYQENEAGADLSHYYVRHEDGPLTDQNLDFGENLVGDPNWEFPPSLPLTDYTNPSKDEDGCSLKVSLSGGAGMPWFVPDTDVPNIDWEATLHVDVSNPIEPKIRAEFTHNLYPAYEVIVGDSTDTFHPVFRYMPPADVLPGPVSLNSSSTTVTTWMSWKGAP